MALFESMDVGERFERSEWPAHVTLASNFLVDVPREQVVKALRDANVVDRPLAFRLGGRALFGRQRNVPVLLAESPHVDDVHRDLADHLGRLRGFAADEPSRWQDGFRPHLTLRPTSAAVEGEIRTASHVAVARLDGAAAEIVACFEIRGARAQNLSVVIANRRAERGHPIVVGVSGYGGAGKSTLARELVSAIPGSVRMRGDDFLDPVRSHRRSGDWDGVERSRLVREVMTPFRADRPGAFRRFDWSIRALGELEPVPLGQVMVVDLIGLFHPEALDSLDLTIWCDVDLATAQERGMQRDAALGRDHSRLWNEVWVPNERDFDAHFAPRERAEILAPMP